MEVALLYPRLFGKLVHQLTALGSDAGRAEDYVQEAFLRAWQQGPSFAQLQEGQQWAWLYKTAHNLMVDDIRHRAAQPQPELPEAVEDDLSRAAVAQVLGKLPAETRRLVVMRYFSGFNSTEIGRKLGFPPATVRTRPRAAAPWLRQLYPEDSKGSAL